MARQVLCGSEVVCATLVGCGAEVLDGLSFPLVVESVPQLADIAAFSPAAVYTHDDVAEVIAHARLHGVRVLPELDMPGHMTAWGTALPELGITMDCGTQHHIA